VTPNNPAGPPAATVDLNFDLEPRYFEQVFAIAATEMLKIKRDPVELMTRAAQPILWLLVFGQVLGRVKGISTGTESYLAFFAPGVLAQSVLFSAIFYGIAVIWERDLGIIHKLLVSPAPRSTLVLGKAIASGLRGLVQAVIIYIVVILAGISISLNPLAIAGVFAAVILGSAIFSTFSLIVACWVKTREKFMGIGQLLTMPLFFASNAIYPLTLMPSWLQIVARLNPLTYLVDACRTLMVPGTVGMTSLPVDFAVMILVLAMLVVIATRIYPNLIR
jgi:ABC-2 type transport system permease protein